jgi:hypothetical protein
MLVKCSDYYRAHSVVTVVALLRTRNTGFERVVMLLGSTIHCLSMPSAAQYGAVIRSLLLVVVANAACILSHLCLSLLHVTVLLTELATVYDLIAVFAYATG